MTTVNSTEPVLSRIPKFIRIGAIVVVILVVLGLIGMQILRGSTSAEKLADGIFRIHSSSLLFRDGSNSLAVQTGAGILLVDTQLPNWTSRVQAEVRTLFDLPISLVINTHWHTDHSGGNDQLTGTAEILAHENVLRTLSGPHEGFGLTGPGSHHSYDARVANGLPERVYPDTLALPGLATGAAIEAVHYPDAHTNGDTVVYVDNGKFVAVGDIVWPGGFPFVDRHNGGNAMGILAAIDDILRRSNEDSIFLAGHREPMTYGEMQIYRDMVSGTIGIVRRAKDTGADLETIIAAGLPAEYGSFASSVVPEATWITMIYRSLEG